MQLTIISLIFGFLFLSCNNQDNIHYIGKFNVEKDLLLAHFDCKTDVDDLHSVAGVATMMNDERFKDVKFHAVAGAYGIQEGLYVPAEELFELAFPGKWSDAHNDYSKAIGEVYHLVEKTLKSGGNIWIADAGQSDFSSDILRKVNENLPDIDSKKRFNVVQHSDWNESVTAEENINYIKSFSNYIRIPDGNGVGNGTPGFRSDEIVQWKDHVRNENLRSVWNLAIELGNKYNGVDGRYLNESIKKGGLDFSDVSETCWIFGYEQIKDANEFLKEFN